MGKKRVGYYLTISSWVGYAPGAKHYYGRIRWYEADRKPNEFAKSDDIKHMVTELCRICAEYDKTLHKNVPGNDPNCDCNNGWITGMAGAFESRKELVESAKQWFRVYSKNPKEDVLFNGGIESGDPIEILYGPADFKKRGNALWKAAVKIDYYENDEKKMNKISEAWEKLLAEYSL
jgi:hypothetical protein